jgi:hypothetical protein
MAQKMETHVVQAYKDACDNLMYLKKEQFQVTYYTWLLLAALYILARGLPAARMVLLIGALVVGALSIGTLVHFQRAMGRFRERLNQIYRLYFTPQEVQGLGLDATSKHPYVVRVLGATCAVASIFTAWAIYLLGTMTVPSTG